MNNKLGVLVTRPESLSAPLVAKLQQIGAQVWHYPTLKIQLLGDDPAVLQAINQLNHYSWQIFVSRHAVQAVFPQVLTTWSKLELSQLNFAAVGLGTAQELAQWLANKIIYPREAMGGLALLAELTSKIKHNENALIWCGNEPSPLLAQGLKARGINTQSICCYQREKPIAPANEILQALQQGWIDTVIISSGNSMENLILQLPLAQLNHCKWIVVSERLVLLARHLGFTGQIILAKGADDLSVINAIKG